MVPHDTIPEEMARAVVCVRVCVVGGRKEERRRRRVWRGRRRVCGCVGGGEEGGVDVCVCGRVCGCVGVWVCGRKGRGEREEEGGQRPTRAQRLTSVAPSRHLTFVC